jgi:hypothetical protein
MAACACTDAQITRLWVPQANTTQPSVCLPPRSGHDRLESHPRCSRPVNGSASRLVYRDLPLYVGIGRREARGHARRGGQIIITAMARRSEQHTGQTAQAPYLMHRSPAHAVALSLISAATRRVRLREIRR